MRYSTRVLDGGSDQAISQAAALLCAGEPVVIPTETVYGLAADALDERAVMRIFEVKGRPADNPLIVHIARLEELDALTGELPGGAIKLAKKFWPGPLTMILPKSTAVPEIVTAGLDTVAVRMPSHPVALALIRTAGRVLAAPSANLSGRPSPTTADHCFEDLNGLVPLILDGGPCDVGVESTVVDLTGDIPRILRPGAVTPAQIKAELGSVVIDPAVCNQPDPSLPVASPGVKHTHYRPKAEVVVLNGRWENCERFLAGQRRDGVWGLVFEQEMQSCPIPALSLGPRESPQAHAKLLFLRLRQLDDMGAKLIYARPPEQDGIGLAVYNRLIRAAGFNEMTIDG